MLIPFMNSGSSLQQRNNAHEHRKKWLSKQGTVTNSFYSFLSNNQNFIQQ